MADRALVRNAGDRQQLARADRLNRDRADMTAAAYRAVMQTPAGRFVLWDLILKAGVFSSVWTSSAEIHAKAARHDFGLNVMRELQLLDGELFQAMEREWWDRERKINRVTEAANAAATAGGANSDDSSNSTGGQG